MCGLAGFVDFGKNTSQEQLLSMASTLSHRGPDGQGYFYACTPNAQVGLAHLRLSIIDLSSSACQPQHFDGLHIIFNGEIYNFTEIRLKLIDLGHKFYTNSDTEVILHAWRQWGEDSISQWRGMFSIVLYDEHSNEIVLIRDRAGVKPLFFYWNDGLFLFASELKSFHEHPGFTKLIDKSTLALFIQFGYVPSPHCIFSDTYKLLPGHILRLSLHDHSIRKTQYWNVYDAYNQPKLDISLPEAISQTEKILIDSFRYRLVADVPVGVFLSGGYDSTSVAALLQSAQIERLKTFTIGTTDMKLNEAPFARDIAQYLGTDHTEYICTPKEAYNIIPELPFIFDEPFSDSSAIPTILVSRLAKKSVSVALSADGGDEIFAGYNRYDYFIKYGKKIQGLPAPIRQCFASLMEEIPSQSIPYLRRIPNFHSRYAKLRNLLRNPSESELLKNLSQVFSVDDIRQLFATQIDLPTTFYDDSELMDEFYDPLSFMMVMDYQTYLLDDILVKVDRATMSTGLEGREPFLDQNIIEWAARLPTDYKYRAGNKKYILRQIVHKYVPKTLMDRPKMGFGIPIQDWLGNELRPLLLDFINENSLSQHKYFNNTYVLNLLDEFLKGKKDNYLRLWHILMFQMWYSTWFK